MRAGNEAKNRHLQVGKKWGSIERQRSLLFRSGPHKIAIREVRHEEPIEPQKLIAYLLQQVSEHPVPERMTPSDIVDIISFR